jgi:transcriptional regulator with XRE-family HTH domain
MVESFSDRLNQLTAERGFTRNDVIAACDAHKSTVSKWYNGINVPERDNLELLAQFFRVDARWLISGKTPENELQHNVKLIEPGKPAAGVTTLHVFNILSEALQSTVSVDDSLVGNPNAEQIHVSNAWLREQNIEPNNCAAYQVRDNIQNPPLMPGSVAIIDTGDTNPVDDNIYVIDQGGLIRMWKVYSVVGGYRFVSPNPDYPDELADTEDVVIRGRVRRFFSPAL